MNLGNLFGKSRLAEDGANSGGETREMREETWISNLFPSPERGFWIT